MQFVNTNSQKQGFKTKHEVCVKQINTKLSYKKLTLKFIRAQKKLL